MRAREVHHPCIPSTALRSMHPLASSIFRPDERQRHDSAFLYLPLEIRCMIYRYFLTAQLKTIKPPSERSVHTTNWKLELGRSPEEIAETIRQHRASCRDFLPLGQSYTGLREIGSCKPVLQLSVLRVNKQIHHEAANVLYGENDFQFILGITRGYPREWIGNHFEPPYHDFRDNLTKIAPKYVKMIRRCAVEVRMPGFPWTKARKIFLEYKTRLSTFAALFGGNEHSLQRVGVYFNKCFRDGYYFPPSCVRQCQNVLEPLATIHGVTLSAIVSGVTPAFEAKISMAMTSKEVACWPKEDVYGTRKVIIKGKRKPRAYKLGNYYDSKIEWNENVLGPDASPSAKASNGHKCCEVCTGQKRVVFEPFSRK